VYLFPHSFVRVTPNPFLYPFLFPPFYPAATLTEREESGISRKAAKELAMGSHSLSPSLLPSRFIPSLFLSPPPFFSPSLPPLCAHDAPPLERGKRFDPVPQEFFLSINYYFFSLLFLPLPHRAIRRQNLGSCFKKRDSAPALSRFSLPQRPFILFFPPPPLSLLFFLLL